MLSDIGFGLSVVVVIIVAEAVSERTTLPSAVLLVVVGSAYTALPMPVMRIDPTVFFDLIIPPLLYAAAIRTSLVGLRQNRATILSLSVVLVLATTFAVAGAVSATATASGLPLGLAAAVVLGAAVASTDPVAALAVARRVGMPVWIVTLLAGEGLLNDGTSLTLFQVGTGAVGGHASILSATGTFFAAVVGGVGFGLVVSWLVVQVRRRVHDSTVHGVLSIATPFAAYLPAEAVHTSGVLAVVVCGLWMGHRAPASLPGESRLRLYSLWQIVEALLQGFVFFLIGDQLDATTHQVAAYPTRAVALAVAATVGAVLGARALWLWTANLRLVRRARLGLDESGTRQLHSNELVVLWWSGARGAITLAAAYSIPRTVDGHPFPDRALLVFCAYVLVLFTLLVQGTTLTPIARAMHLPTNGAERHQRLAEARTAAAKAGLDRLDELLEEEPQPDDVVAPLRSWASLHIERSEDRLAELGDELDEEQETRTEVRQRLHAAMIEAGRVELVRWRDEGRLPDRDLRVLQREIDHAERLL